MSNRSRFGAAAHEERLGHFAVDQVAGLLHEQVRALILSRIEAGEWPAGTPIPPEVQLASTFGVSIGTVRKALDQLARDRVLVRERGRGTFVKHGGSWRTGPGQRLCGADGAPIEFEITVAGTDYMVATAGEFANLRMLRPASIVPRALRLRREWRREGALLVLETITVDAARFPNLQFEIEPSAEVLFQVYAEKYHTPVDRTVWTMKPLVGSDDVARELTAGRDVTVMRCLRTAFDAKDMPLEISEQIIAFDGDLAIMASQ